VLFYYALFFTLDLLATFVAFLLERKEDWRLLIWLMLQRFLYRQLMYYVAIKSTLTAIRGQSSAGVNWTARRRCRWVDRHR